MLSQQTFTEKLVARAALCREIFMASLPAKVAAGFAVTFVLLSLLLVIPGHWDRLKPGKCFWITTRRMACWRDPKLNPQKTP